MSFAEPNQILVSRSYYEIVSRLSQEYTRLFQYAGHPSGQARPGARGVRDDGGGRGGDGPGGGPGRGRRGGGPARPGGEHRVRARRPAGTSSPRCWPASRERSRKGWARSRACWCGRRRRRRRISRRSASCSTWPSPSRSARPSGSRLGDVGGPPAAAAAVRRARRRRPGRPGRRPARPLSPEVLAEAADRLAVHIGPVAKLLVKRAAKQASSTKDLYERLAGAHRRPAGPPALRGGDRGALGALARSRGARPQLAALSGRCSPRPPAARRR